jgi:streptogramin lyase
MRQGKWGAPVWVALSILALLSPPAGAAECVAPTTAGVAATIQVGGDPSGVAVGGGSVWVTSSDTDTLSEIDPAQDAVVDQRYVVEGPGDVAFGLDHLWVIGNVEELVQRVHAEEHTGGDPGAHDHELTGDEIQFGRGLADLVVTEKYVWVTNHVDATVSRIAVKKRLQAHGRPIPVPAGPLGIAAGEGGIWVVSALADTVTLIDLHSGRVIASILVGDGPSDVTTGFGLVWVVNRFDGTVTRIDPRSRRVVGDPIDVGTEPSAIAAGLCGIWVTNFADDTVTLIDPSTGAVVGDPISVGDRPDAIAVGEGAVWVASVGGAVTRIHP